MSIIGPNHFPPSQQFAAYHKKTFQSAGFSSNVRNKWELKSNSNFAKDMNLLKATLPRWVTLFIWETFPSCEVLPPVKCFPAGKSFPAFKCSPAGKCFPGRIHYHFYEMLTSNQTSHHISLFIVKVKNDSV